MLGTVLWLSAAVILVLIVGVWALSVRLRDASIVDPAWGLTFAAVALVVALAGDGDSARRWLLMALTAVWGLRLGLHLGVRKWHERGEEDRRYAELRAKNPDGFALRSLYSIFLVQGLLIWIVALPVQVAATRGAALSASVIPGAVIFLIGLFFEAVGDEQLRRFKASPDSAGKVMDTGLWRYTRHPNYFGDTCVWWGLWLMALVAGGTWWTVISPLIMTLTIVQVSGKELLERDIGKRRPGYAEYVQRTSGFFPLPPRSK